MALQRIQGRVKKLIFISSLFLLVSPRAWGTSTTMDSAQFEDISTLGITLPRLYVGHAIDKPKEAEHAASFPEGYPSDIHGYLYINIDHKIPPSYTITRIVLGTLMGPNQVIVESHHFSVPNHSYISGLDFYPLNISGKDLPEKVPANPANTLFFDWKIDKLLSSQNSGGAAVVMLKQPIGNRTGYISFYEDQEEDLNGKTVYLGGIHGRINLEALQKGKRLFYAHVTENKIKSAQPNLLQVESKPNLLQHAAIMIMRAEEKYSVIALGRGVEDKEIGEKFYQYEDLFLRLTRDRVREMQAAIEKSPQSIPPDPPLLQTKMQLQSAKLIRNWDCPDIDSTSQFNLDLSDVRITPRTSEAENEQGTQKKLKKKVRMRDKPKEHHLENDIGNILFLSYWYVFAKNPIRPLVLLLCNGKDVHPLAKAMAHEVMAYTDAGVAQTFANTQKPISFFNHVLSKLRQSFLANQQKIAVPDPALALEQSYELRQTLDTKLSEIQEIIKAKERVLASLEGRTADGQVVLGLPTLGSKENIEKIRQILSNLRKEKENLHKERENLNKIKGEIKQTYQLMADQETLLSVDQKEERKCLQDPNAYMTEKFSQIKAQADAGDMEALNRIGLCHFWGWGCTQDFQEAMNCFIRAAASNNCPKAYENIGLMLEGGFGHSQDPTATSKAYTTFAQQDTNGYLHLAHGYLMQDGVENRKMALMQLRIAATSGNPIAFRAFVKLDIKQRQFHPGIYSDYIKCFKDYYEKLVQADQQFELNRLIGRLAKGELEVLPLLGRHYIWGQGCEKNSFLAALGPAIFHLAHNADIKEKEKFQGMARRLAPLFQSFGYSVPLVVLEESGIAEKLGIKTKEQHQYGHTIGFKEYDLKLRKENQRTQQDIFDGLIERVSAGDLAALPLLSHHYAFGRGCKQNYFLAALCFAMPHLAQDTHNCGKLVCDHDSTSADDQKQQGTDPSMEKTPKEIWQGLPSFMRLSKEYEANPTNILDILEFLVSRIIKNSNDEENPSVMVKKLEELAREKIKKLNGGKELNSNEDLCALTSKAFLNNEIRQALGHCFLWGWKVDQEELCDYEKAAVIFCLATKKKVNSQTWTSLYKWITRNSAMRVEPKEKNNWLKPADRNRAHMSHILNVGRLDAAIHLALQGYSIGYHIVAKAAQDDAPTLAKHCLTKIGNDPKAISQLAVLYFTVEDIDGKKTKKERQKEAFKLWFQAAMQGYAQAEYYAGYCLHEGLGTERDEAEGMKLLNLARTKLLDSARTKRYKPNEQIISRFKKPLTSFTPIHN